MVGNQHKKGEDMPHHKIKSEDDIRRVMGMPYEDGATFQVLETGEIVELPDLLHNYDGQEITIQYFEAPEEAMA